MPVESYDPETDRPQNGTHEQIKSIYNQLMDAGYGEAAALRNDSRGTSEKIHMAKQLQNHLLTPDTLEEKAEKALEETSTLSKEQREEGWKMLARADTMESVNEEHATSLREEVHALAEYGKPQSHAAALSEKDRAEATELLARADTMNGVDPEVSGDIREQAVGILEETVKDERGDVEQHVIDRDVEATIDDLGE